jgi:hypothetical protein
MSGLFRAYSAAVPTTAAMTGITTGTAIKTHLQITAHDHQVGVLL